MVRLPASPLASSSALWPASDTAFSATRHTRPTLAVGTAALTPFASTTVSSRPSRSGGLHFHSLLVDFPNCSSTCQVRYCDSPFCIQDGFADITSSLRYRLLARAREHERSGLSYQPPEYRFRLHHQLGSLFRYHRPSPCLGLRWPCDRWRLCHRAIREFTLRYN